MPLYMMARHYITRFLKFLYLVGSHVIHSYSEKMLNIDLDLRLKNYTRNIIVISPVFSLTMM
jgi:hypothetical protein